MQQISRQTLSDSGLSLWQFAFKLSLPILFAYFPLGLAFGMLFNHLGYAWYYAFLMSALVFGGAVQFIALGIIAAHGSLTTLFLSTIFVALRNAFYGLSLTERYKQKGWRKWFLIFTLVDATYAILTSNKIEDKKSDEQFCLILSALNYSYWISGTLIGAYFSNLLPEIAGLEFILTSFFTVLAVEKFLELRKIQPFVIALVAALIAFILTPHQMLLTAILITLVGLMAYEKYQGVQNG